MYPHQSTAYEENAYKKGESSTTASIRNHAAYMTPHDQLFGPDGAGVKVRIVAHPLFEQLVAAHVACLRVSTPLEQQHIIDSALANRHHAAAKYVALLSHMQSNCHPAENEELTHFMVNYILLLQSFKEQLYDHVCIQAVEAMLACQEIEQALFNLTGVSSSSHSSAMVQEETKNMVDDASFNQDGLGCLGINAFLPLDIEKALRQHVQRELKQELKKDYLSKLKEVRDEILLKRRAGKLPEDKAHVLKAWWLSHAKWPYPTEEEKAQLMDESGLELKQINSWFNNKRKRSSEAEINSCESEKNTTYIISNPINKTLPLKVDNEDLLKE